MRVSPRTRYTGSCSSGGGRGVMCCDASALSSAAYRWDRVRRWRRGGGTRRRRACPGVTCRDTSSCCCLARRRAGKDTVRDERWCGVCVGFQLARPARSQYTEYCHLALRSFACMMQLFECIIMYNCLQICNYCTSYLQCKI